MSYGEGNAGARHKALTGGAVALIQGGIAVALISGLAVTISPPAPPKHLPTTTYLPTTPITPEAKPVDEPRKDPIVTRVRASDPVVDRAETTFTLPTPQPIPTTGGVDRGEPGFVPSATPSTEPAVRFTPKAAVPRGNMAGWVTTEDYPGSDLRQNHSGTVRFRLALDASGKVSGCTITQSSGYQGLDATTCRLITRRARFDPARNASGDAAGGTYEGTIRWVIPQD